MVAGRGRGIRADAPPISARVRALQMEPPRLGGPLGEQPVRVLPHSDRPDLWLRLGGSRRRASSRRSGSSPRSEPCRSGPGCTSDSGIRSCPSRPRPARRRGSPRASRALRAGLPGRGRSGSGRRRTRRSMTAGARTPVDSTRRAANRSAGRIAGPPSTSRGNPVEPPRGRTQLKASARRSKKSSRTARFEATISRLLAMTRSRARRPMSASTSEGAAEQIVV